MQNGKLNISTNLLGQKIYIWAGIFNNNIIGPSEITGVLISETYLGQM